VAKPVSTERLPVAILAGGLATRLRPLTETIPKALIEVAGAPFVDHQLGLLKRNGYHEIVFCVGYLGAMLQHHVGNGERFGLNVRYVEDGPTLLGTGGALRKAAPLLGEAFAVLYGDSYLPIDYARVEASFRDCGKPALMTAFRNRDQYDRSNVVFRDGVVVLYDKNCRTPEMEYIDYGLSVIRHSVLEGYCEQFDLASAFTTLSMAGKLAGFEVTQRFFEIGSPAGLVEAENYLRSR
jgi:N-acetyl-alpha-D-muramate 1-phosphate uridylyltransferase